MELEYFGYFRETKCDHFRFDFFFRGKVVMPTRIGKPWLLFDWVYDLTKISSSEMDQKQKMDLFTQEACTLTPKLSKVVR